jgi:hypothetical protein
VTRLRLTSVAAPGVSYAASYLEAVFGSADRYDPNHVTWWPMDTAEGILADRTRAEAVLRSLVTVLDPIRAAWLTDDLVGARPRRPDGPMWGWITYVAHSLGPPPATAGELFHRGQLVRLTADARDALTAALLFSVKRRSGPTAG